MSDSDSSSISSVDEIKPKPPPAKRKSNTSGAGAAAASGGKPGKAGDKRKRANSDDEDDGEKRVVIGNKRYVSLSNFHGRFFVDIREFYEDKTSGELKPGKKGIALTLEQWENLKSKIDAVDKLIKDA